MAYEADADNVSKIAFRFKKNPKNHWAAPFVTGHKYYVRWSYGLDFERMRFEIIEPVWRHEQDKDIVFELPFFDVREDIIITDSNNDPVDNSTLSFNRDYNRFGNNYVFNETVQDNLGSDFEKRLVFSISA